MRITRRRFMSITGTASAGLAAQACSSPSRSLEKGWIDAHVHVWTPDTRRYPLAEGFSKSRMQPPSFTPEELFAHSRPNGVTRIVLIQMSFYKRDNRYMLDCMRTHPGVFGGVAIIDENVPAVRPRMNSLAQQGVRGFRLYASRKNAEQWKDSDGIKAMWAHGGEAGLAMCCLTDPGALPAIHDFCTRFPETPVVIDHFARIGMRGPVQQENLDRLLRLADFPRVHVKTSAFYALGGKEPPYTDLGPMIRQLRDAYGAERLMWATDCPFQVGKGHTYKASLSLIRDHLDFLTPADKQWMLRGTAEKVFFG